nr:hypothetical protein [Tissierella sp.]
MEKQNNYYEVSNKEKLLERMKERKDYILIKGDLKQDVKELLKTTLSDKELMGLELGSAGSIGISAEIFYQIFNYFSDKPKIDKKLESSIRQYRYKIEDGDILLYHRHLDY